MTILSTLDSIDLDAGPPKAKRPSFTDVTSNLFGGPKNNEPAGIKLKIDEPPSVTTTPLPGATAKIKTETEDGFKTFNEIPVTPVAPPAPVRMSPQETLREKLKVLRALEAMEKKEFNLPKYTMDSPLLKCKENLKLLKPMLKRKVV